VAGGVLAILGQSRLPPYGSNPSIAPAPSVLQVIIIGK
jgi:hypothetical protein